MSLAGGMYSLPPLVDMTSKLDLPSCMYSLPVLQSSSQVQQGADDSHQSSTGQSAGYMERLEKRQEAILTRLGQLKDQVSAYKQSIGLPPVPSSAVAQSASQAAATTSTGSPDLVIKANPCQPPLSLWATISLLQSSGYSLYLSCHTHSSVTDPLPNKVNIFTPITGIPRRQANVRISLIWSTEVSDCELMVSPLIQSVIRGEVNMLRYLARTFPGSLMYETSPALAVIDCILDGVASYAHVLPKNRLPLVREMTSRLSQHSHLAGDDVTIADLALASLIKKNDMAKDLQPDVKKWFELMSDSKNKSKSEKKALKTPKKEKHQGNEVKKEKIPDNKPLGKENTPPGGKFSKAELFEFFSKNKITFTNVDHPEVFTVEAMMPYLGNVDGAICKNLFLKDKKKNLFLLSAAHDKEVKLADVAKKVGAKELRFGDESVMEEVLGVSQGCVTAFALVNDAEKKVKFVVDSALLDGTHSSVNFHPLVNTATTGVATQDFVKFLKITGHQVLKF